MNDQRKTKKQLLEALERQRELLERERERSIALQEVSKKVAAAHGTDEVLNLIVNEAARLVGAHAPQSCIEGIQPYLRNPGQRQ